MRFSRARYVTLCQQSLVTAAVLALGVSAAGVKTLDIVPQPGTPAGAQGVPPQGFPRQTLAQPADEPPAKTKVDAAPVTPKVREVRVTGIAASAPGADTSADARRRTTAPATQAPTQAPTQTKAPTQSATPKAKQAAPATKRLVALSEPQAVTGYATVGVTWKHGVEYSPDQLTVQVRMEDRGKWSTWRDLDH
ncbi:MAG: hypothetical protein JWR85_1, partial [Marmoricola sp.]|nr:hypothetical protein [Marmoricola sp.]